MKITFLLVDALNLIRRIYAAHPGEEGPEHTKGALESTVHSLQRALRETGPTHAACIFDSHEKSWRHDLLPTYKEGRPPMPDELKNSLNDFKSSFLEMGITSLTFPNIEADDIIATLAHKTSQKNGLAIILSTDKSFLQLLSENISVRDHFNKKNLDRKYVEDKFSVESEQLIDLFALAGDSTNHIPGIPKVGLKTAAKLINEHQTLENIISRANTIEGKIGEKIRSNINEVALFKRLVRLQTDISMGLNLKTLRYLH
jgi:protein Xni